MIGSYLTDIIKIISVSSDKYGKITETESAEIKARVEDYNKLIMSVDGKETMASIYVAVKSNNSIKYADKIKIVKKNGVTYFDTSKKWQIKSLYVAGGFSQQIIEVYL